MSFVIDRTVTLTWFFKDGRTDRADVVPRQVAKTAAVGVVHVEYSALPSSLLE